MRNNMKTTDFRIGNLINYKIVDNMDPRKEWFEISEIDYDDLRILQIKNEMNQDYQPIILNEELLLKCGFQKRKQSDNFYYFGYGDNPITKDWMLCLKYFSDENKFFFMNGYHTIKYVHELQNLYYALTKEELILCELN